jgi:hypothetical protein
MLKVGPQVFSAPTPSVKGGIIRLLPRSQQWPHWSFPLTSSVINGHKEASNSIYDNETVNSVELI